MDATGLFNDENAVINLLSLKKRVHVLNEQLKVLFAIPVRYHNGHLVMSLTVGRMVSSTWAQTRPVHFFQFFHRDDSFRNICPTHLKIKIKKKKIKKLERGKKTTSRLK